MSNRLRFFLTAAALSLILCAPLTLYAEFAESGKLSSILAPDGFGDSNDWMGRSISVDGNRLLVGAPAAGSGSGVPQTWGEAYIYEFDPNIGEWRIEHRLVSPDLARGTRFGEAVALDGDRAVVGAWAAREAGSGAGAAYVFERQGSDWVHTATLIGDDTLANDRFGYSVALDDDLVAVGSLFHTTDGQRAGAVYAFEFSSEWLQTAKFVPAVPTDLQFFGQSVSVDPGRIAVGAPSDNQAGTGEGAVYLYTDDGTVWSSEQTLISSDPSSTSSFGFSVDLDGGRLGVGIRSGAVALFENDGSSWIERQVLAPSLSSSSTFGSSLDLQGDRIVVGDELDTGPPFYAGVVYVFDFDGTSWSETASVVASDGAELDQFGITVALSGDRFLVGAPFDDDQGTDSGSVYAYQLDAGMWTQGQKIALGPGGLNDRLGSSIDVSGNWMVVGAPFDWRSGQESGAAFVYEFDGVNWNPVTTLLASDADQFMNFGTDVAIDGQTIVVGVSRGPSGNGGSGRAYVFEFDGSLWQESSILESDDLEPTDQFGTKVDIEGNRIIVGASNDSIGAVRTGSAYTFVNAGAGWNQEQKLVALDGADGDGFGSSVAINGTIIAIGAFADDDSGSRSGSVYLFENNGGAWAETQKLIASDGAAQDLFGVEIYLESNHLIVGAEGSDAAGVESGAAYAFSYDGSSWGSEQRLLASDAVELERFGRAVVLSGERVVIGAPGASAFTGRAYVFRLNSGTWLEDQMIAASDGQMNDSFGSAIGLSERSLLIGAPISTVTARQSGAVYTFLENSPPIAQADVFAGLEDQGLAGSVFSDNGSGADSDPDGDSFEIQSPGVLVANGIGGPVDLAANGDFTYTPPLNASGVATFDYTIIDPSGAADSATVTITVAPVNDQPTFTAADPAALLEDAGAQSVPNWAAFDAGAPNELQGVSAYTVSNVGVPGLFSSVPSVDGSGTLTFTPAADAFGTSTFDVVVQDDGGTANGGVDTSDPQTFTITIDPVNDAPSFANAGDVTEIEDGDYAEAWASAISAGPANEGGQTVSFMTTVTSNPGLFDVAPSVDPAGTLTFTPLADTTGSASIEVVAMDDGGMANGGVPASDPATFTIDVIAAADLTIDKTSGSFFTAPEGSVSYTIVVGNPGPSDVTQATVVDDPPARLGNVSWTCTPSGSAACNPSGSVAINEPVNLPEGTSVTFTLDAELLDDLNDPITNTASVTTPAGVLELVPANNADSDTDLVGLFADSMESVEP